MAVFASRRVTECDVVRRGSLFEFRLMARIAHRGHDLEFAVGRVLVAGIAIDGSVRAGQREAIIVLLNILGRHSPSADSVALLTICAQLALMNIGMAVLAARAHIAENRFDVALRTSHILVHTAQRIACLVVIELGNGADRLPSLCSVAVLTGNVQVAMWTIGTSGACRHARKRAQE